MLKAPALHARTPGIAGKPSLLQTASNSFSKSSLNLILFAAVLLLTHYRSAAQMSFTAGNLTQTENFDGMSGYALPSGFTINAVSGTSASVDGAATSLFAVSSGKAYRFGSTGGDFAIGFLNNNSSYTPPRSIMLTLANNTGADITGFTISFDYEKYRTGASTLDFNFYGSTDNVNFTGYSSGDQHYAADANSNTSTFSSPPTAAKSVSISGISIPQGGNYYLRWTLSGTVSVSNSGQAIGIDDISITAVQSTGCTAPSGLAASNITSTGADLSWGSVSGASGYEYVLDQNSGAPSGSGTATTATGFASGTLSASTTYYLHVRTDCGSGSYSSWTTTSFSTTSGCTPPAATITPSGATSFCTGGSVILNANTGTGLTYQWRKDAADIPSATNSDYTATAAGNYKVVVSNGSCADSSTAVTITVHTQPTAGITPAGATTFCAGSDVVLNANTGTGLSYQWRVNGADINGATSSAYTASAAGDYKVVITNSSSCSDSSAATTITVNALPTATITPAGPTTFCSGGSAVLNANTGSGLSYQWRKDGVDIPGASTSSYTANTSGDYKVVVTNGSSCSDSSTAITVTANLASNVTITPAGPTTFCDGGNVVLDATSGTGLSYQWKLDGNNINGATGNSYLANAAGDYKVVVTNGASCTDSSTATTITVNTLPTATVTPAGPTTFCAGGNVILNANTGTGLSYQWRKDGANINGATGDSYTANANGDYKVIVTNSSSCSDSSVATTINVHALPTATITPAGNTAICSGSSVMLNANTGTGLTYQWKMNGTDINGATGSDYTANAAGDYKVVVTNSSSCTDSSAATTVTVNTLPTATITPAGPTTFCAGNNVLLNANTGTGYTYQWRLNGVAINGATGSSYTANAAGDYKVIVTNNSSCSDSSVATTVTVNALPAATITPAGPTTFCTGNDVLLNANSSTGLTYQWKMNGVAINGATGSSYTANAAGDYKVVVTNGSSCTDSSAAATVTINALPTATITPAGPTTFCTGNDVLLNANTGTGFTYQWKLNGVAINGATGSGYTANASGDYKVVVTNSSSCSDSSAATTVTVNALPTATITPAGPTTFCSGSNVVLDANSGTGLNYQWTFNGNNIIGATGSSYTANAAGDYKVVVTNGSSCTDSSSATTVTINALPTATITPAGPTTFCAGGDVLLDANTGTGLSYQWTLNGANITGATSASYTAGTAGDYKLIVTNSSSCTDSSAAVTITVNALPAATATASGATTFCAGGDVTLSANSGTGLSYQWQLNGTAISGETNINYTANASGDYTVLVTNTSACTDSSAAITITVNPMPVATITALGNTTFCADDSVEFTAGTGTGLSYQWQAGGNDIPGATNNTYFAHTPGVYTVVVSNGNCTAVSSSISVATHQVLTPIVTKNGDTLKATAGYAAYQWYLNGQSVSGATSNIFMPPHSGNYTVIVTDTTGCTATSAISYFLHSGIPSVITGENISMYPNPAANSIQVEAPVPVHVMITTADGRLVLQQDDGKNINISNLAQGMYLVRITDGEGRLLAIRKLLKTNE